MPCSFSPKKRELYVIFFLPGLLFLYPPLFAQLVHSLNFRLGLSWWSSGKESAFQCRERGFDPWLGNEDPTCLRETKPMHHNY